MRRILPQTVNLCQPDRHNWFYHHHTSADPGPNGRTNLDWGDIILALASGAAGVLAFTSGGHLSLIGVMMAVALMPPLVTAGLLFGKTT